ncbi:Acidic phosphoprotein precursor PCEMA1, putative [Plasmodium chabaudi adami]|uniref:Acidic phosphoprotein PCEMA1, putative n=1 Tax=Plasmodium chabaudi adami TaxID=5826 RepID=A0A1D3L9V5_PLACE|nr:Acidic phosphoprotein precursor PCEMA1, putative [Plasmodium chabaudi adami]
MNKFYIQIVFFLLSIFVYANNEILATESDPESAPEIAPETSPEENTTPEEPLDRYLTPIEMYEKNKHLLCTNHDETINAIKLMNEAVTHLKCYATNDGGYELCQSDINGRSLPYYKKKHEDNTYVLKVDLGIHDLNKYNKTICDLWNPDNDKPLITGSAKIVRVYNQNLVMIQHRYKKKSKGRQKYFYALATKAEISKDQTIIAMTSANINDHNPFGKEYKNTIVESANLFTTDIDSEEDIREGKLKKVFVNLAGYLIEKRSDHIYIAYVESIDGHYFIKKKELLENI